MNKAQLAQQPKPQRIKIVGIQRIVGITQSRLANLCEEKDSDNHRIESFCKEIDQQIKDIHLQLRRAGCTASKLTGAAQTAYHWLVFISKPETAKKHVQSLTIAHNHASAITAKSKTLFKISTPRVCIQFYNTRYLYKGTHSPQQIKIILNEAFIEAPPVILENLVHLSINGRDPKKLDTIRQYSRQPAFLYHYKTLYSHQPRIKAPAGGHYDLQKVFERVNKEYFMSGLPEPRLGWSSRKSLKKLGHYQIETDILVISKSLDSPQVPNHVIDFVMYHELLHKQMGATRLNGRTRSHTSEFRATEKKFRFYQETMTFLEKFAKTK